MMVICDLTQNKTKHLANLFVSGLRESMCTLYPRFIIPIRHTNLGMRIRTNNQNQMETEQLSLINQ